MWIFKLVVFKSRLKHYMVFMINICIVGLENGVDTLFGVEHYVNKKKLLEFKVELPIYS